MFIKKKKENMLNFGSKNYKMKDFYDTNDLFVTNLEYVSSLVTGYGPMVGQRSRDIYLKELMLMIRLGIGKYLLVL